MQNLTDIRDGARECAEAWERVDRVGAGTEHYPGGFDMAFSDAEAMSIAFAESNMDLQRRLIERVGALGTGPAYRELEAAADEEIRRRIWGLLGHKTS